MIMEEAGLKPDWIIGDMDSLDYTERLDKYDSGMVLHFPAEKNLTDTELALDLLKEKGCDEIWIAGGGGGRVDHLLAIRSLFDREFCPARWFPGKEEIRCLKEGEQISAVFSQAFPVSVLPVGMPPWQAESSGLKWPLRDLAWENGGLGLSNVAQDGSFKIQSIQGRFLVIIPVFLD